jgi:pimeloyl-ACP methyl ester carboxylesterase
MSTYALIHGAGDSAWHWHRVAPLLSALGHDVVAVDLPCADEAAGLSEYAGVVVDALGEREDVIVVAQSLGGFVAPIVATRRPVELIVFVNGMVPRPGERDWWAATRYPVEFGDDFDEVEVFLHDVPPEIVAESANHVGHQAGTPMSEPWPLERWPDAPMRFVLSRDDRLFPAAWMRGVVRDRLGIEPDEIDGGHCPALSRPQELVDLLERIRGRALAPAR